MTLLQRVLDQLIEYSKMHEPEPLTKTALLNRIRKWALKREFHELANYCQKHIHEINQVFRDEQG